MRQVLLWEEEADLSGQHQLRAGDVINSDTVEDNEERECVEFGKVHAVGLGTSVVVTVAVPTELCERHSSEGIVSQLREQEAGGEVVRCSHTIGYINREEVAGV